MSRSEVRHARRALEMLSTETGGIAFFPKSLEQVDEIAAEVARDIRSQYTLGYHSTKPTTDTNFRRIQVLADEKGSQAQRAYADRLFPGDAGGETAQDGVGAVAGRRSGPEKPRYHLARAFPLHPQYFPAL